MSKVEGLSRISWLIILFKVIFKVIKKDSDSLGDCLIPQKLCYQIFTDI